VQIDPSHATWESRKNAWDREFDKFNGTITMRYLNSSMYKIGWALFELRLAVGSKLGSLVAITKLLNIGKNFL
jgi:hypothetical protein